VVVDDETSYKPDALVNRGDPVADGVLIAPNPVIVVEVLSPTTRNVDRTIKVADYFRVPGLGHYLIIDLGRRHVLHYRRQSDGVVTVVIVKDVDLDLDPPGIALPAASLFALHALADPGHTGTHFMRALMVFALMSLIAAAMLSNPAQAQTSADSFKPVGAGKQVIKHKKMRKVQSPAPAAPTAAAPRPILEERPGPKMGM
jgi:hypothetical protein